MPMTSRALICLVLCAPVGPGLGACVEGGQGGDEGALGGPSADEMPGDDRRDAGVEPHTRGPDAPVVPSGDLEGGLGPACSALRWPGPDSERTPYFCFADFSSGPWSCECAGEGPVTSELEECGDALLDVCGVEPDPPSGSPDHCIGEGADEGTCWQREDGGWDCRCGDAAGSSPLEQVEIDDCKTAVFRTCAATCEEPLGRCDPVRDGVDNEYRCDCAYYGEVARPHISGTCHSAIEGACNPEPNAFDGDTESECNSYAGYCDAQDGGYACHCVGDGADVSVDGGDDCPSVLTDACGADEPPEASTCRAEGESAVGRCVELAEGVQQCRCDAVATASDPDAMTTGGTGLSTDPESRSTRAEVSCELALSLDCPDAITADEAQRTEACEHHASCNAGVAVDSCSELISDACASCTLEARDGSEGCDGLERCGSLCSGLIPPPATAAECRSRIETYAAFGEVEACLCDACLPSLGECLVDPGCSEILTCASETGCRQAACYAADTCRDAIDAWGGPASSSANLATTLGSCAPACEP